MTTPSKSFGPRSTPEECTDGGLNVSRVYIGPRIDTMRRMQKP